MGCCGKAREAARGAYTSVTPQTATTQPTHDTVTIRYLGRSAIRIPGSRTGRVYTFRPEEPDQPIDCRDAEVLLRTGLFRKGGQSPVSPNGGKSGQSNGREQGG